MGCRKLWGKEVLGAGNVEERKFWEQKMLGKGSVTGRKCWGREVWGAGNVGGLVLGTANEVLSLTIVFRLNAVISALRKPSTWSQLGIRNLE